MLQDAGDEGARERGEVELAVGLVEPVDGAIAVPAREVQVTPVARLVAPGLGRERGVEAMLERHAAHGLPIEDVVVGGLQSGRVPDGKLLLTPAKLGIV